MSARFRHKQEVDLAEVGGMLGAFVGQGCRHVRWVQDLTGAEVRVDFKRAMARVFAFAPEAAHSACLALEEWKARVLSRQPDLDAKSRGTFRRRARTCRVDRALVNLGSQDAEVRREAIVGLGRDKKGLVADRLDAAVEGSRRLLDDPHPEVRSQAVHTLGLLGVDDPQVLVKCLDDENSKVVVRTLVTLGRLQALEAAPRIARLLDSQDPSVQVAAVGALGELGFQAAHARIQELRMSSQRLTGDAPCELEQACTEALARLSGSCGQERSRKGKVRVYELAKELGMDTAKLKQALRDMGFPVKTASSGVSRKAAARARADFAEPKELIPAEWPVPEVEPGQVPRVRLHHKDRSIGS